MALEVYLDIEEPQSVDVCIATYKRPEMLSFLLNSLAAQSLEGMLMRIIVVDNDIEESAKVVVQHFRDTFPYEVVYDVEAVQNVSNARNRCLSHVKSDFVAFVDDDEVVCSRWLSILRETAHTYNADAVFGPVVYILADGAPTWAAKHPAFITARRGTGESIDLGATNNVLMRRTALGNPPLRFDSRFGLSLGDDTDFFRRMHMSGKRFVWSAEAMVFESVPSSRTTIGWTIRRAYMGGQSFALAFTPQRTAVEKVLWGTYKSIQLTGGLVSLPFFFIFSMTNGLRVLMRICSCAGQISTLFGERMQWQGYKSTRYKPEITDRQG